jgi:peptide/nickel transport system permease protein
MRHTLKHNKTAMISAFVLAAFLGAAIFADFVAPHDPLKTSNETFQSPSQKFLFGTDDLGRDIFSGVVYGARTSILISVSVALFSGLTACSSARLPVTRAAFGTIS